MVVDVCSRCGRHPIECGCAPHPAMLEWSTERAYSHGENVISLRDHQRRRDWNRGNQGAGEDGDSAA